MPGKPIPVPLIAPLITRDNDTTRFDAFMKNVFAEQIAESEVKVFKRPGLRKYSSYTVGTATDVAARGNGITSFFDANGNEQLYTFWGGSVRREIPGVATSGGITNGNITTPRSTYGAVTYHDNKLYVMLDDAGGDPVYVSTDNGATWTAQGVSTGDGLTFVMPFSSTGIHFMSALGYLWFLGTASHNTVTYNSSLWRSVDGIYWTRVIDDNASLASNTVGIGFVEYNGYLWWYKPQTSANSGAIYKATVGDSAWTEVATGLVSLWNSTGSFYGKMIVWNGALYALGANSNNAARAYTSSDGVTWTDLGAVTGSPPFTSYFAIATYGGIIYALCHNGGTEQIWYSTNGLAWSQLGSTNNLFDLGTVVWGGNDFIFFNNGRFISVAGGTTAAYKYMYGQLEVTDSVIQSTTITTTVSSGFFDFAQNEARTVLAFKNETDAYTLTIATQAVAQVTDSDYPSSTVRGLVYLNGRFYVMDHKGIIYGSDDEDFTAWNALTFLTAQNEPDHGKFIGKYKNYIVALGAYTTEFFYDAGNPTGSPLSPMQNSVKLTGCAHGNSVQYVDDTMFWVAQAKGHGQTVNKGRFVVAMNNLELVPISDPNVDRILDASDFSDIRSTVFRIGGHTFYHLMLIDIGISLVYDVKTKIWHWWGTKRDSFTHTLTGTSISVANSLATLAVTHSFNDGDVAVISGFTDTNTVFNGTVNVTAPNSSTLIWPATTTLTAGAGTGTATGWSDDVFPIAAACHFRSEQILQDYENGKLYVLDPSTYQDDSKWIENRIRLIEMMFGSNREKFMAWADIVGNRVSANILLRYSDDDLTTWSKFKKKSLNQTRVRFNRLGSFHRRNMELLMTDNTNVQLQNFVINVEGAEE